MIGKLRRLGSFGLAAALAASATWVGGGELLVCWRNPAPRAYACSEALPEAEAGAWVRLEGCILLLAEGEVALDGSGRVRVPLAEPSSGEAAGWIVELADPTRAETVRRLGELTSTAQQAQVNRELAETDPDYAAFLSGNGAPTPAEREVDARTALAEFAMTTDLEPLADVEGLTAWEDGALVLAEGKQPRLVYPLLLTLGGGLVLLVCGLAAAGALLRRGSARTELAE